MHGHASQRATAAHLVLAAVAHDVVRTDMAEDGSCLHRFDELDRQLLLHHCRKREAVVPYVDTELSHGATARQKRQKELVPHALPEAAGTGGVRDGRREGREA